MGQCACTGNAAQAAAMASWDEDEPMQKEPRLGSGRCLKEEELLGKAAPQVLALSASWDELAWAVAQTIPIEDLTWLQQKHAATGVILAPPRAWDAESGGCLLTLTSGGPALDSDTSGGVYKGQTRQLPRYSAEGEGTLTWRNGASFSGHWENNSRHGMGAEKWPDGTMYLGQYKDGAKSGHGTLSMPDGGKYEGQFAGSLFHGEGTLVFSDDRRFKGDWREGKMHGWGVLTCADGRSYIGNYASGVKQGQGTYTWPNGRLYHGQWRNGKQHGYGTYIPGDEESLEKKVWHGEWINGKRVRWILHASQLQEPGSFLLPQDVEALLQASRHSRRKVEQDPAPAIAATVDDCLRRASVQSAASQGSQGSGGEGGAQKSHRMFRLRHGAVYKGQCVEVLKEMAHGHGTLTRSDGLRYVGQWESDRRHGRGEERDLDGSLYSGEYLDDDRCGEGTLSFPDGSKFVGQFLDGMFHGTGCYTFGSGSRYDGQWRYNRKHGSGVFAWPDGHSYTGEYAEDCRCGPGKFVWSGNTLKGVFEGQWLGGKPHGYGSYTPKEVDEQAVMPVPLRGEWKDGARQRWIVGLSPRDFPSLLHASA